MYNLEYAVLRLIPNARRQEVINIGLVVFFDDGFKMKLIKNYRKITALCPTYQLDLFPTLEEDIQFITGVEATFDDVSNALKSLGGFSLGPKSQLIYSSKLEIPAKLEELMCTFVYPETNVADHQPLTLYHELRKQISQISALSTNRKDLDGFQIVEWYAIDEQGWFKSEFAFKTDDRTVFIQTVDLRVSDRRELFRTLSSRKMIGEAIRESFGDTAEIVVAYRLSRHARDVGGAHLLSMLHGYADEIFDFEDTQQVSRLTDKVAWNQGPNKSLPLFH